MNADDLGLDWPHIEGMPQPLDDVNEVAELSEVDRRLALRDHATVLDERRPA